MTAPLNFLLFLRKRSIPISDPPDQGGIFMIFEDLTVALGYMGRTKKEKKKKSAK